MIQIGKKLLGFRNMQKKLEKEKCSYERIYEILLSSYLKYSQGFLTSSTLVNETKLAYWSDQYPTAAYRMFPQKTISGFLRILLFCTPILLKKGKLKTIDMKDF